MPGWSFSALVVLPQPVSSWIYVLDHQRVASTATAVSCGAKQLATVVPLLPCRAVLLLDRYYAQAPWLLATADLPIDQLIRARADQRLYRPAPPLTGKRGAPRMEFDSGTRSSASASSKRPGSACGQGGDPKLMSALPQAKNAACGCPVKDEIPP